MHWWCLKGLHLLHFSSHLNIIEQLNKHLREYISWLVTDHLVINLSGDMRQVIRGWSYRGGVQMEKKIEVLTRTVPNIITWDYFAIKIEENRDFN